MAMMNEEDATGQGNDPITIAELAAIAKTRLKRSVWDYYECGADSQTVLHENESTFNKQVQ